MCFSMFELDGAYCTMEWMSIKLHDSGPSLKFDIKCVFMWSHLWAGVVRVGHRRAFRDQSTCSALLLVLTCNHEDHGDDSIVLVKNKVIKNGDLVPRHLWEWPSSQLSGFETTGRETLIHMMIFFICLLLLIIWILIDKAFQTFLMVSANAGMERIPWKSELQNDSKSCSLLIPTIILKGMFCYWYSIVFKLALY